MKSILILVCLTVSVTSVHAQVIGWLSPGQVADKTYGNLKPRILLDKNSEPMVVWGDDAGKIWFSRWGGEAFTSPLRINTPATTAFTSSTACAGFGGRGDTIFVVYKTLPGKNSHVYTVHSYDGGRHFSVPERIDPVVEGTTANVPVVSADENGNAFVAYQRVGSDNDNPHVVLARSDDMGETFKPEIQASIANGGFACECSPASVVVSGQAGLVLYRNKVGNRRNIYASLSNNGALTFLYTLRLDTTNFVTESCPGSGPDGVIVGDTLYAVFMSGDADNGLVYLSRVSLASPTVITRPLTGEITGIVMQNFPTIAGMGNAAAVAWTQTAGGNNQVCLKVTDDLSKGFPDRIDTVATGVMLSADVAMGGGFIYAVWQDEETKTVMFRRGVYNLSGRAQENTSFMIASPPKGQKYFMINKEGIINCLITDVRGNSVEADISYPKSNSYCKVDIEDLEPGVYTVKIYDSEGRTYTSKLEIQ